MTSVNLSSLLMLQQNCNQPLITLVVKYLAKQDSRRGEHLTLLIPSNRHLPRLYERTKLTYLSSHSRHPLGHSATIFCVSCAVPMNCRVDLCPKGWIQITPYPPTHLSSVLVLSWTTGAQSKGLTWRE